MCKFGRIFAGVIGLIIFNAACSTFARPYDPPVNLRTDVLLDSGWKFIRQDVTGAAAVDLDDSAWSTVALPHTWNNLDGEDGNTNYYRGVGWYRIHCFIEDSFAGRQLFLKFDGAFLVTDVYVNGNHLGEHRGGFADFVFDATPYLKTGADNVIAVKVSNAANANIPPPLGGFYFFRRTLSQRAFAGHGPGANLTIGLRLAGRLFEDNGSKLQFGGS